MGGRLCLWGTGAGGGGASLGTVAALGGGVVCHDRTDGDVATVGELLCRFGGRLPATVP